MEQSIPSKLKKLWDVWDIPTCVLLSLFLQVFLVMFASMRQRSKNPFLLFLIWLAYLSANWIAAVTVGLISRVLTDPLHPHNVNEELYAFWACFLLLHLGGPDTITSFAVEDNEFWLRHLLGLILQVSGAGYCIFLTFSNNSLWIPTILVFVVGSVKYAERTMSLYLASLNHFEDTVPDFKVPNAESKPETKPEPEPEPEPVSHDHEDPNAVPTEPRPEPAEGTKFDFKLGSEPNNMELLMVSYSLFQSSKGIVLGSPLSSKLVESSRDLFRQIKNPKLAFKLIEYELSFIYEVFHTKATEVRSGIGLVFRLSSFCFIVGAFVAFPFLVNKDGDGSGRFEISLTYSLLVGAIVVDAISGIQLMRSDWILVSNNGLLIKRWRKLIPERILKRRRWCESVSQYNMIAYCLNERWFWKHNLPGCFRFLADNIKIMLFSSQSSMDDIDDLKCIIFENRETLFRSLRYAELHDELKYTKKVLQMHLVTEICYHQTQTGSSQYTEEEKRSRRICKLVSDYMFYLLVMKPEILRPSIMGINWQKTFEETFEEAKRYLMKYRISDHVKACKGFIDYTKNAEDPNPAARTVLSIACSSAEQLLEMEKHWEYWCRLWVEELCFGALRSRSSPMLHAEQARKGGELLTFIWFLLHHHLGNG